MLDSSRLALGLGPPRTTLPAEAQFITGRTKRSYSTHKIKADLHHWTERRP